MKNLKLIKIQIVFVLLFSIQSIGFSQTAPNPIEDKKHDVMPVYNADQADAAQTNVDKKNTLIKEAAASATPVMPGLTCSTTTTSSGKIVMIFINGTIDPYSLSALWAKVSYKGKTEYWKLDPSMISDDGKSFTMQFGPEFDGVTFTSWKLYGFGNDGAKTNSTNAVSFRIDSPGSLTMPASTAPSVTSPNGQIAITFASAITPDNLSQLWAKVTCDGKTEYWKLDPGMISADGRTFSMKFDPSYNGKTMKMELFGYAASDNSQTNTSNAVTFKIESPGTVRMPSSTAPSATDEDGKITVTFAQTIESSKLSGLWARVICDGKTEYWKLDPGMISDDGKTFSMEFDPSFDGKTVSIALYGFASSTGAQTNYGTTHTLKIKTSAGITMPDITADTSTDMNRTITIRLSSAVLPSSLKDLWAIVTYDGVTEYWDLDPSMISDDGKTLTMEFEKSFVNKRISLKLYGIDAKTGAQTNATNAVTFKIVEAQSIVTMPTLPSSVTAGTDGTAVITFSSGTLPPSSIKDIWAQITIDGKTEYWDLDPAMLSSDGKKFTIEFDSAFAGKIVSLKLYAFDNNNVQTGFSNAVRITIPEAPTTTITMPVLPSSVTAGTDGTAVITFSSGTLLPSSIKDLWAQVTIDGKTEYWDLDPAMLSSDGKKFTIEFDSAFAGKIVSLKLYAFDNNNVQTGFSNAARITIPEAPTTPVTMPVLPSNVSTDTAGKATVIFSSGTLTASQLTDLWAQVTVDGKTEYWDLDPAMLSADGKSFTIDFSDSYNGKTIALKLYGFDKQGVRTAFSNTVNIAVAMRKTPIVMPQVPAYGSTDSEGNTIISFTSGTLSKSALKSLWAEATYDNKTEYWDITPDALSENGKSITLAFDKSFNGKTVRLRFYGFDTDGLQIPFSNPIIFQHITSS